MMAVLLLACRKPHEMRGGDHHVANHLATGLKAYGEYRGEPVKLLRDSIPPGDTVHIAKVWEGSGGHLYPSNFFSVFRLTTVDSTGAEVVAYEGVDNDAWQLWNNGNEIRDTQLLLLVQ